MVVTDIGWMGDLPDDVARKVPVDVTSIDLAEACASLLDDSATRGVLGTERVATRVPIPSVTTRSLLTTLAETPAAVG